MNNTHLIRLLRTFTPYEINSFRKFVLSPFFNSNSDLIKFFNIIISEYPVFNGPQIAKEKVFRKIYPGRLYNDKKIRDLTYGLLKLSEEFMGISFYQKNKLHFTANDVLSSLGEKKQMKLFNKRMIHTKNSTDISKYPNNIYFYNKWRLESIETRYMYFQHGRSMDADTLIEEGESLVMFTIISLSYIFYNISVTHHTENTKQGSFLITEFIKNLDLEDILIKAKKTGHKYAEMLEIYHCLIMMLIKSEEEKYFFRLKDIILRMPASLTKEDLFNIFANLTAFCNVKVTQGNTNFIREGFEIYKEQLKSEAYFLRGDGAIGTVMFHNILQLGLYLKEFEWIEGFISEYGNKVVTDEIGNMVNYGYASLNFEKGKFNDVIIHISKIKTDHFFLRYEIKQLFLRTYFELDLVEPLISLIDSSKHFLSKHRSVSDERKVPFGNFIRFLEKLTKFKADNTSAVERSLQYDFLYKEISAEKMVTKKSWLLEKAASLKFES